MGRSNLGRDGDRVLRYFRAAKKTAQKAKPETEVKEEKKTERKLSAAQLKKVDEIVRKYFERFDKDGDDIILRSELPRAVRTWGFNAYDKDGDGKLSREEVREQAKIRVK